MMAINHALTGTAIALVVRQPLLIAPLAFLSHFVLDAIPHSNEYESKHRRLMFLLDGSLTFLAIATTIYAAPQLIIPILVGAAFAMLPDVFWIYYFYMSNQPQWWFFRFHQKIQWYERRPGLLVEISYAICMSTIVAALLQ